MDYTTAMSEIKKSKIRPIYLLHGEETHLARQLEQALINAVLSPEEREMSLTVFDRDPVAAQLVATVETYPFMGGKNVVVVRGTNLFKATRKTAEEKEESSDNTDDRLLKLMASVPEYSVLVFSTPDKADKRKKLYKAVDAQGAVVELEPLKARDVRPWLMSRLTALGRKMAPDAQEHFLAAVTMMPTISLGLLESELDKIALYAKGNTITRKDLLDIMSAMPEVSVFTMIEAISQKQVATALKMLEEQFAAGENAIKLLSLLSRQVRHLWRGKELNQRGLDARQVAEQLGVPPFVGEKIVRQARGFTLDRLKATQVALAEADRDLKCSRADKYVLERIIIEMCR